MSDKESERWIACIDVMRIAIAGGKTPGQLLEAGCVAANLDDVNALMKITEQLAVLAGIGMAEILPEDEYDPEEDGICYLFERGPTK